MRALLHELLLTLFQWCKVDKSAKPLTVAHIEQQPAVSSRHAKEDSHGEKHPGLPGIWHLQPNSLFGDAGKY